MAKKPETNGIPQVRLKLGSTTYQLHFDCTAGIQAQIETGIDLTARVSEFDNPSVLRAALWAALLPQHPGMLLEDAGRLIRPRLIPVIVCLHRQ